MKIPNALVLFVLLLTLVSIACGQPPVTPTPTPQADNTPTPPPSSAVWTPATPAATPIAGQAVTPTATIVCTGCGLRGQP